QNRDCHSGGRVKKRRPSSSLPEHRPPSIEKILIGPLEERALRRLVGAGLDREYLVLMLRWIPVIPNEKMETGPWTDTRRVHRFIKRLRDLAVELDGFNNSLIALTAKLEFW